MLQAIFADYPFDVAYGDLEGDLARLEAQVRECLPDWVWDPELAVELFVPVLYRNKGPTWSAACTTAMSNGLW